MAKTIKVIQNSEKEVPVEVLAEAIVSIGKSVKSLLNGRLNRSAVILMICHACPTVSNGFRSKRPITKKEVSAVLDGMESLEKTYLKQPVKP